MKIAIDNVIAESNADSSRQQFGIADINLVMNLLSKLYSNPKKTLTQEYLCNARDANREAKQTRPIEVTVPTKFLPTLKIRDFGPGLSPERIKSVFLFYGASTKRDTNTQAGGFGIGSKSGFAYTDSFTITSWYAGKQRTYVIHKSGGNGNMDLVEELDSIEANGVQVEIAIKPNDVQAFVNAVLDTIYFWNDKEQPKLINFDYTKLKFETFKINNTFYLSNNHSRDLLIIDGISYPFPASVYNLDIFDKVKDLTKGTFTVYLNNGELNIAPNREEVIDDEKFIKLMEKLFNQAKKDLDTFLDKEFYKIFEVKDVLKKLNLFSEWLKVTKKFKNNLIIDSDKITFIDKNSSKKEAPFEKHTIEINNKMFKLKKHFMDIKNGYNNLYYIDNNEHITQTSKRIKNYLLGCQQKTSAIYLLDSDAAFKDLILDLNAKPISSLPLPIVKKTGSKGIKKEEICLHIQKHGRTCPTQFKISNITTNYIYASYEKKDHYKNIFSQLFYLDKKCCFIAASSINLIKNNSNFQNMENFAKTFKLTDSQLIGSMQCNYFNSQLQLFKSKLELIKDLELVKTLKLFENYKENLISKEIIALNPENQKRYNELKIQIENCEKIIQERYILLNNLINTSLKEKHILDIIKYINLKYKERNKQ